MASSNIQFDDSILPVGQGQRVASAEKRSSVYEKHSTELDDEEKARQIAGEDLHGSRKQKYSGLVLLWLSFQSVGVIYGDIGTSPLYVFSSTFSSQPSWDDLVGSLSIIIWSLTLIVTVKYTFIVLSADDDGQGGTFALYSLLSRYINITRHDPNTMAMTKLERYQTGEMKTSGRTLRSFLEHSSTAKFFLKFIGVLGVSLLMADGVLTPAQSVLGAVQGIRVVKPELETSTIIGISVGILVFLFLLQPFGTARLGTTFAPIVTIWLLFNLVSGIYNLAKFDYTVLKAFSPYFAFNYFTRNGHEGWKSLGGILLAFTGVEALFADLGAFSKRAVQVSWLGLAYPCLLFAYIGQAAFISADATETAFTNPFFFSVPPGTLIFSLVIAILAAIVASQAMITSTFQLLVQVMRLSFFPHIKVVHTSKHFHEQVYIPIANWLLMIGTVIVTGVYNNTTSLGNAYGVCVILVTFITTWMVALVAILIWRLPIYVVLPVFLTFAAIDGVYTTSVLTKVPDGAWFTLLLAVILSAIHILWRYGKEAQWTAESLDRLPASSLLTVGRQGTPPPPPLPSPNPPATGSQPTSSTPPPPPSPHPIIHLTPAFNSLPLTTVPGLGIFFDKAGDPSLLPPSFVHFVAKFAARPQVLVFFHMRPLPVPSVPLGERFVVTRRSSSGAVGGPPGRSEDGGNSSSVKPCVGGVALLPDAYSVVLRHGYADDVLRPGLARDLVAQIELAVSGRGGGNGHLAAELDTLRRAVEVQTVYVLGKEAMRIKRRGGAGGDGEQRKGVRGVGGLVRTAVRRVLLGTFLWIRENSRAKLADLDIDVDKLVEVGFVKEI
ncbi:potassium transporter [Coniochaeta ligniaria NRRL 30616]|uniref:Potassium transporter n=1 Tax=Coniochaeta ligniaria NRRL 30616 TaxID=1408157 RepID=A0A1J7JWF9_9PEZI|nr:potassium transporter [Coniochaeta ligniaria NRRL 30616]